MRSLAPGRSFPLWDDSRWLHWLSTGAGISDEDGRPIRVPKYSTFADGKGADVNHKGICPAALGSKDQQPAAFSPKTGLFYVPTNNLCMDFEGREVTYIAGTPYIGGMAPEKGGPGGYKGEFIAWDAVSGRKVWGIQEPYPVWGGALATAGNVVFYGTLDGWFKAVDARNGKVLYQFKVGSGVVGNPMTYTGPDGKQYIAIYSGIGGDMGLLIAGDVAASLPFDMACAFSQRAAASKSLAILAPSTARNLTAPSSSLPGKPPTEVRPSGANAMKFATAKRRATSSM